jgi:hypothetical protein
MNKQKLIEAIEQVLKNQQLDLVLTEGGYESCPKNNTWSSEFLVLLDGEGIRVRWEGEPNAGDVAEWVCDNVNEWVNIAIDSEEDELYGNSDKLVFLKGLLEKL